MPLQRTQADGSPHTLASLATMLKPSTVTEYVYFIQSPRAIKIGWSTNPDKRLFSIQASNAERLRMLAYFEVPNGLEAESHLHEKFRHLHIRGEWFRPAPELLAYLGTTEDGFTDHSLRDIILQVAADRKARKGVDQKNGVDRVGGQSHAEKESQEASGSVSGRFGRAGSSAFGMESLLENG